MAQHDYQIINQSGASFRADINSALEAIATNNSGSTAPSTTYARQFWADSATEKLKVRNAGNTAYIEVLPDLTKIYGGLLQVIYPVGSIYTNATNDTNPGVLLGIGTWTAFGAGRVLVGINAAETEFNVAGETGGAKTHTLLTTEIPAHSHSVNDSGHSHTTTITRTETGTGTDVGTVPRNGTGIGPQNYAGNTNTTGITIANTGGGGAHNNLQPYVVVYMWVRIS
jgi:hypothetical protein